MLLRITATLNQSTVDMRAREFSSPKLPSWTPVFVNRWQKFGWEAFEEAGLVRPASVTVSPVQMMHRHAEVITLVPSTGRSRISMCRQRLRCRVLVLALLLIKVLVPMNDLIIDFFWSVGDRPKNDYISNVGSNLFNQCCLAICLFFPFF